MSVSKATRVMKEADKMDNLEIDPLGADGLAEFASALRTGANTSEKATRAYLARI